MTQTDNSATNPPTNLATESTTENSTRLSQFQTEIDRLGVTGGRANLERRFMRLGILVAVLGLVCTLAAYFASDSAEDMRDQIDMVIFAMFGVGLIILGGLFVAVNTVTRFLRYWLVRLIYELRDQTDRITDDQ